MAPAEGLPEATRQALFQDSLRLTGAAKYLCAGTVEFLVDKQGRHFFIEVNPRVQVEHTVTEEVTGIDVVQSQIRLAAGASLEELGLVQEKIKTYGYAMQCRVTTEDPSRDFQPDSGHIEVFRAPGGMGIRIDDGPGFVGANITPYYDSLLIKITSKARREGGRNGAGGRKGKWPFLSPFTPPSFSPTPPSFLHRHTGGQPPRRHHEASACAQGIPGARCPHQQVICPQPAFPSRLYPRPSRYRLHRP